MNKLRDNLYVSSYRDVTNDQALRAQGITAVLNVAYELNDPEFDPKIVKGLKVGLMDSGENADFMKKMAVETAKNLINNGETLLVHCAAGLSRSVYVCTMTIAELEGKDWHDVFIEVQKIHPFALLGPLFHGSNAKYYQYLERQEEQNGKA